MKFNEYMNEMARMPKDMKRHKKLEVTSKDLDRIEKDIDKELDGTEIKNGTAKVWIDISSSIIEFLMDGNDQEKALNKAVNDMLGKRYKDWKKIKAIYQPDEQMIFVKFEE